MFAPFRIWFVGATHRPVRTGELAGKGEPPTAASVRLAGRDFIVTSQVSPARWQPNREVRWELPGFKYPPRVPVCHSVECESVCW